MLAFGLAFGAMSIYGLSKAKGKEQRIRYAVCTYLEKSQALLDKLKKSKEVFPLRDVTDLAIMLELERFMELMDKHVDLLERRIIKRESGVKYQFQHDFYTIHLKEISPV